MVRFGGARISGTVGEILLRRELAVFVPAIVLAGYWFGNMGWVQANLSKIIWALILVPGAIALISAWRAGRQPA